MPQSTNTTVDAGSDASKFVFGSTSVVFPIVTGWYGRAIGTSDAEPEVFQPATNGDGMVEQVGLTTAANRMRKMQLEGYIDSTFVEANVPNTMTVVKQGQSYYCFVKKVSDPYPKGNFVAVLLDVESYPLVQT